MVVVRLKRRGVKNSPSYRVCVADSRRAVKGHSIETLGSYNPLSKKLFLDKKRYDHWLALGAKPSLSIQNLVKKMSEVKNGA